MDAVAVEEEDPHHRQPVSLSGNYRIFYILKYKYIFTYIFIFGVIIHYYLNVLYVVLFIFELQIVDSWANHGLGFVTRHGVRGCTGYPRIHSQFSNC